MPRPSSRFREALAAALAAGLGLAAPAVAQTSAAESRALVIVSTAAAVPTDGAFHDVFTGWSAPFAAQADVQVGVGGLAVIGGVRHVGKSGAAVAVSGGSPAGLDTRFEMTSWRVGAGWTAWREGWRFAIGGGVSHNAFREEWADAPELTVEDSALGMFAGVSAARPVWRQLAVSIGLEVSSIKAPVVDPELARVNLGSFDMTFGVGWAF